MTPAAGRRADPVIICGGMGARISWWVLARVAAIMDALGVVSGTALDVVYARMLQDGDPGGHIRRAFAELARRERGLAADLERLLKAFYVPGGRAPGAPYKPSPMWSLRRVEEESGAGGLFYEPSRDLQVLTVAANFSEVWLAKEGHGGPVGVNYLRKIERPLPWALYGAVLAGADYVVVGAGSPPELPGMIGRLSRREPASLPLKVFGAGSKEPPHAVLARPAALTGAGGAPLEAPRFLAIVSSFQLARALASDPATRPHGFVIEGHEAGGHSAPPAVRRFTSGQRQVVEYTKEDDADVAAIAGLGLPFWLAGSYARPERLKEALDAGAKGIQLGTVAALCGQSGMRPDLRERVTRLVEENKLEVQADAVVSPSGFPFKVALVPGTLSDPEVYRARKRVCDVGHLQSAYIAPGGSLAFRCPAEPVEDFVRKGGRPQNAEGRACLCNGLLATAGLAQVRPGGYVEPPIVTLGNDFVLVRKLLAMRAAGQAAYAFGKALRHIQSSLKLPGQQAGPETSG